MTILLWVVLTPVALALLAAAVFFGRAVVSGVIEGLRSEPEPDPETPQEADALGLLPRERQNTDLAGPEDPALTAAVAAAKAGDWKPAAVLLEDVGEDWERRSQASYRLGDAAVEDDEWLLAWEKERPGDPGAALVRARSTVSLAWEIRGAKRAQYTTSEQFEGFHRTLVRSREEIARAAELNPADPTPYITEIWTGLGLGYPHAEMDRLWGEITARAPHHYEAHFSALQYWCAKWRGSAELARDFAAQAAAKAPLGSLLTAMPLIAWWEHRDAELGQEGYDAPEITALVDAALADAAAAPADHPRLPELRHLLAFFLTMQDRDDAALEQFRLVDGYVDALPWRYDPDPAAEYCRLRDITLANASPAAKTP